MLSIVLLMVGFWLPTSMLIVRRSAMPFALALPHSLTEGQ